MRSLTFHKAVISEIWASLSASHKASVERVWHTPNAAHQPKKPGLSSGQPFSTQAAKANGQQDGEAAPDVDVLVDRVSRPLHGHVAEHLEQRRRQVQDEHMRAI